MNAFSVLAAAYGFVGAFSQVVGKVSLNRRVRKKGLSTTDYGWPSNWILNKEASSDLIDILTFGMISLSFLFAIFAEFSNYTDWRTGVVSNLPLMVVLPLWVFSVLVIKSDWPDLGHRTWTLVTENWEWLEFHFYPILLIVALPLGIIYLLFVGADKWFAVGLVIPQIALAAAFVILDRSSWIFK